MSRQIIYTVGTSLLTNRDERPWAGWNPRTPDPLPAAAEIECWLGSADLVKASAETNTFRSLASQADRPLAERTAPRRIWFMVDRRIVVDEAFARSERIAKKQCEATDGPVKVVAGRLRQLTGTERPLAVARLRGGLLRDYGWRRPASLSAVTTSTVDRLGLRLLLVQGEWLQRGLGMRCPY
jgi:hypothetical protein